MSDDDEELWKLVTKDVQAYGKTKAITEDKKKHQKKRSDKKVFDNALNTNDKFVFPMADARQVLQQNSGIDRRTAERLRKGQIPIDARLDLHGLNQVEAAAAVTNFILNAATRGLRCVLIITGKGMGPDGRRDPLERGQGVLRQKLPEWLFDQRISRHILKTVSAQPQHGGSGASYVLLRRNRTK